MKIYKQLLVALSFSLFLTVIITGCSKKTDPEQTGNSTPSSTEAPTEITTSNAPTQVPTGTEASVTPQEKEIKKSVYSSMAAVHDPSIVKDNEIYYLFGSHMEAAESSDLWTWKSFANGVNSSNKLFLGLFESSSFDWVGKNDQGGYSVWAPDVIYNKKLGKYTMYYCTTSDWNTSTLCLATSDNIKGPYEFQANLIHSGFKKEDIAQTNVKEILGNDGSDREYYTSTDYNSNLWPNALDPSVFYDADGRLWMVYGSWSGGIFILEIDEETGLVIHPEDDKENGVDKYFGKHLLGYGHTSCEAPYILYEKTSGCYYLFVSYGGLTSTGGYNIRLFRSENPDGPYVDAKGQSWTSSTTNHSAFGIKLMGNYILPSLSKAYMAPGHNSALADEDGKLFLVYHTRFDDGAEFHQPRVHQMFLNEENWLVTAPFAFNQFGSNEETISPAGYPDQQIIGDYYLLSHMIDTSAIIHEPTAITLNKDGTITGAVEGTWEAKEGTYYATIVINNITYKGVFFHQKDEAFQDVMTFTCISDTNISIWGVKYE